MSATPPPPTMSLKFRGAIWHWRGPAPYYFVTIPERQCADLRAIASLVSYGWGVIPVTGQIGRTRFQTSLFPKDGRYLVPLKDSVRKAESLAEGDTITLRLEVGLP